MITLHQGDCLEVMKTMSENSVDAIVSDPPYELGFMGKSWDSTGIANNKEMWAECLRVLKPGGYLLSFGGTRTYHRMACAIEDAGFEVRDMIEWVYGSGFPKSLNIGKAVDKLQGNEREKTHTVIRTTHKQGTSYEWAGGNDTGICDYTKGTSEYEGWGTALKPAHEPICMARKPISEKTVAENCLKWGTGGINIDESRVEGEPTPINKLENWSGFGQEKRPDYVQEINNLGRFPANLIHDNSEEVRECFPETKSGSHKAGQPRNAESKTSYVMPNITTFTNNGSSGNASRFFKSIIYQAKAGKSERNAGCEGLEETRHADRNMEDGVGGDNPRNRTNTPKLNFHPTVKPVALMEYLIKMVTPKAGTVLDPFMGSGTTGVACRNVGCDFVGIELDESYLTIAKARIESTLV